MLENCDPKLTGAQIVKTMMAASKPGTTVDEKRRILQLGFKEIADSVDPANHPQVFELIEQALSRFKNLRTIFPNYKSAFAQGFNPSEITVKKTAETGDSLSAINDVAVKKSEVKKSFFIDIFGQQGARAELYYKRQLVDDFVGAFLVDRKNKRLVTEKDINKNVRALKQELVDRIRFFMEVEGEDIAKYGDFVLFPNSTKTNNIFAQDSSLRQWLNDKFVEYTDSQKLQEHYNGFKKKGSGWQNHKAFLDAFNAWVSLNHFDTVLELTLPGMIKFDAKYRNQLTHEQTYATNLDKATNMWSNGFGDDVENIADLVSEVTQVLIQSSKYYAWGSNQYMEDKYLSFQDFNDAIGRIKSIVNNNSSKSIILEDLEGIDESTSKRTQVLLKRLKTELRKNQPIILKNGVATIKNPDPTLYDLVSMISKDPQDYLHAIFDILCNTDAISKLSNEDGTLVFDDITKNVIWSINKEIFGTTSKRSGLETRSIFDLHENTQGDTIYEIVSQIADSMFSEDYLQYYQDRDGKFQTRLLRDYAIDELRRQIKSEMQESNGNFHEDLFKQFKSEFGITVNDTWSRVAINAKHGIYWKNIDKEGNVVQKDGKDQPMLTKVIKDVKVSWPDEQFEMTITGGQPKIDVTPRSKNGLKNLWESKKFRDFINKLTGIDFESDVDMASSYEEVFRDKSTGEIIYSRLIDDIAKVAGTVLYNQVFNNDFKNKIIQQGKKDPNSIKVLNQVINSQFGDNEYHPTLNRETGDIYMIAGGIESVFLGNLAQARAINYSLTSAAQVKTGEGTALANFCLSRLRNSYHYQLVSQMKKRDSAVKDVTFVENPNGFYQGVISAREVKTDQVAKASTEFSAVEAYQLSFVSDWVAAFIEEKDKNTYLGQGKAAFLPTVNSDKGQIDRLIVNLYAETPTRNGVSGKRYIDLNDAEIESEMQAEFGPMYNKILENTAKELNRFAGLLNSDFTELLNNKKLTSVEKNREILRAINHLIMDPIIAEKLGIDPTTLTEEQFASAAKDLKAGKVIEQQLHKLITNYNSTHTRNPIELASEIHYIKDGNGLLTTNKTLEAMWGRFSAKTLRERNLTEGLYAKHEKGAMNIGGFFKLKDIQCAVELLRDGFVTPLFGKVAQKQNEIMFLKGETQFNNLVANHQDNDPAFYYTINDPNTKKVTKVPIKTYQEFYSRKLAGEQINFANDIDPKSLLSNWICDDGTMAVIKVDDKYFSNSRDLTDYITGLVKASLASQNKNFDPKYFDLRQALVKLGDRVSIHPMMSKLNRMSYLATQQYVCSVGGAHYVYNGKYKPEKGAEYSVLEDEAARWLASNKRNVCYASTVHKMQGNTLQGNPNTINMAIIDDIKSDVYSIMGDLDSHKPIDGGMFGNGFFEDIENNSLAGERAGTDQKTFGTFMYENYAAGGIIKTAKFVATNDRMRRSIAWRNLQKNMSDRVWVKEFAGIDGADIVEANIDINLDCYGNKINLGPVFYSRQREDGKLGLFRLAKVNSLYSNGSETIELEASRKCELYNEFITKNKRIPSYGELVEYANKLGYNATNQYSIYEWPVSETGVILSNDPSMAAQATTSGPIEPVRRMFGSENGVFTINTNWNLFNTVLGGFNSLELKDNRLQPSENSRKLMAKLINSVGYKKDYDHAYDTVDGKCYQQDVDKVRNQDDYWQPLKYADAHYTPNAGAIKSAYFNINPSSAMSKQQQLNCMSIMMAQLGIQLDKEHHADMAEVSMPTQIIQACANKGYTIEHSSELYNALSTLTELAIADCMVGVEEMLPGNENTGKLQIEVANIIVDSLIHGSSDDEALTIAMGHLISKAKKHEDFTKEDVNGIAWSDQAIYNQIYNKIASSLTNAAIKMKFPGIMSVICPTEEMEKFHGDKKRSSFVKIANGADTEEEAIAKYQEEIIKLENNPALDFDANGKPTNKHIIFDIQRDIAADKFRRQDLASLIDTQHNYVVEFEDGTSEKITINVPNDYYKLKDYITFGKTDGDVTFNVKRVYENVIDGRTLGAYNVRYQDTTGRMYNIFDLDSTSNLFGLNDLLEKADDFDAALLDPKKRQSVFDSVKKFALNDIVAENYKTLLGVLNKELNQNHMFDLQIAQGTDVKTLINNLIDNMSTGAEFVALRKALRLTFYKQQEKDLFKLSNDYKGIRELYVNGNKVTINPDTLETVAYELIMPKVYQSQFGLEEYDDLQDIKNNKRFFIDRALNKLTGENDEITDIYYDIALRNMSGKHVYILDTRNGMPGGIFKNNPNFDIRENNDGSIERIDQDGETLYTMASKSDRVMLYGDNTEIIVTDNPEYYIEAIPSSIISFSNLRYSGDSGVEKLQRIADNLKNAKSKAGKQFYKTIAQRNGKLRDVKSLKQRNSAIMNLTKVQRTGNFEVDKLINHIESLGSELHTSFIESLNVLAARIPAQSQQSFMPQKVIAFDTKNVNTAMVSTFQLFLQGSDLDIDAVTLLGSEFDRTGRYIMWSPYSNLETTDNLKASQKIPFPTGRTTELFANEDYDSFFVEMDEFFAPGGLFEVATENGQIVVDENSGIPEIEVNTYSPKMIEQFAKFIKMVNTHGLNIKGKFGNTAEDPWKITPAFDQEIESHPDLNILKQDGIQKEHMFGILKQLQAIANQHNEYIKTAPRDIRSKMTKNQCQYRMMQISSAPSNLVESMVGVDQSTDPIKNSKYGAKSFILDENGKPVRTKYADNDKHAALGSEFTKYSSIQEGQVGKQCVGIGAVSIKVNSTCQYYMDKVLNGSDEEAKKMLLFPKIDKWGRRSDSADKRGYVISGKRYLALANLYDKTAEYTGETQQTNPEIIEMIDSLRNDYGIPANVATSLAAMLSVAVDNAKDLALAKMNAGPKTFGFYAYGISLGMDIRELARIINSEQGRAITKMCEGNVFTQQFGAFSALQGLGKLNGKISADLKQFDEVLMKGTDMVGKINGCSTVSELFRKLLAKYYTPWISGLDQINKNKLMSNDAAKDRNHKINTSTNLSNMVFQLALTGHLSGLLNAVVNDFKNIKIEAVNKDNNISDWKADFYQLINWCKNYAEIQNTFRIGEFNGAGFRNTTSIVKDLQILAEGAEEMRVLGTILSSNKGIKSKIDEGNTFIETIENAIIDRKEIMGTPVKDDDHIDFITFVTDENYRNDKIKEYDKVKHSTNILDVISKAPHFLSYLRACSVPYAAFLGASAKFRARDRYANRVYDELGLTRSQDKDNAIRGIENCVSFKMLKKWLVSEKKMFILPQGGKYFDSRLNKLQTVDDPAGREIPLWTDEGLATFKLYMESNIIPQMKKRTEYSDNQFVQGLTQFELSKTGTHVTINAYTLAGNLLPNTESEVAQFQAFAADFAEMENFKFPNGDKAGMINNYQDAFYIYSQYVFGGRKSRRSLVSLFDGITSNLIQRHKDYIASIDANEEIYMNSVERRQWCSPNGNPNNPASNFFYAVDKDVIGTRLMQKSNEDQMEDENGNPKKNNKKYKVYDLAYQDSEEARRYFVNPSADIDQSGKIIDVPIKDGSIKIQFDPENKMDKIVSVKGSSQQIKILREILPYIQKDISTFISSNLEPDGSISTTVNESIIQMIVEKYKQIKNGECIDTL